MKHCVPVGLATPGHVYAFSNALLGISEVEPNTSAYLRARSSDWGAAYGDVAVIFGEVDEQLASLLARLVSDGIAATRYTDEALRILRNKRNGQYLVVEIDPDYTPPNVESREIFGARLVQQRNECIPSVDDFRVVVGSEDVARRSTLDLVLSAVAMKYTVSNNIVIASGGRTLSISAGQQSRILSTKLACLKFEQYARLQSPEIIELVGSSRGKLTDRVALAVEQASVVGEARFERFAPIVMASDGFIPFSDNIEEVSRYLIEIVCEPEGALRSGDIEQAAAMHGMTLVRTQKRFFYH
jgi:phosphoribosylaminoimidazolecarboxamide formyltransferase/IMP cyclohydrolase